MGSSFEEALAMLNSHAVLKDSFTLERSYCTWKTGNAAAALELLSESSDEGALHLKALLLMRTGDSTQAHTVYSQLGRGATADKQAAVELVCPHCVATGTLHLSGDRSLVTTMFTYRAQTRWQRVCSPRQMEAASRNRLQISGWSR